MLTTERTHTSTTTIPLDTRLLESGHIYLKGEIDSETADCIKKQIVYLAGKSPSEPIYLHINSCGGEINNGLMLYDIIQAYSDRITTVCEGQAFSMAAILVAGGKKGRRFILKNSEMMLHEPLISNGYTGSCSSVKATANRLSAKKEHISLILSKHTGKKQEIINQAIAYDHYFSADESVAFGLCDKVVDYNEMFETEAK